MTTTIEGLAALHIGTVDSVAPGKAFVLGAALDDELHRAARGPGDAPRHGEAADAAGHVSRVGQGSVGQRLQILDAWPEQHACCGRTRNRNTLDPSAGFPLS